jgi:hypothetical protein
MIINCHSIEAGRILGQFHRIGQSIGVVADTLPNQVGRRGTRLAPHSFTCGRNALLSCPCLRQSIKFAPAASIGPSARPVVSG